MCDGDNKYVNRVKDLQLSDRIRALKLKTIDAERYMSLEQARIITDSYLHDEGLPVPLKRARALARSLREIPLCIDPDELIVGNRTPDIRAGVVFPEAGISWLSHEIDTLPSRPQDPFHVREEDIEYFRKSIQPFWKGKTLEDDILNRYGQEIKKLEKVVKINQKDHAQGHICPDVRTWLKTGPAGLLKESRALLDNENDEKKRVFYESVCISLSAACTFINRYGSLATDMAFSESDGNRKDNLLRIADTCNKLAIRPPSDFREAVQSVWFLFVILQMESNASSFSPGRLDQYLYSYLEQDLDNDNLDLWQAVELLDALFIKFNQIVYMRNKNSARYFAGFPTGFNITIGGQKKDGTDATNILTYLILKAHEHTQLPQPNLTARIYKGSPTEFLDECSRIIGLGTGMPQMVNDNSIIPSLLSAGISAEDTSDYVLVGCVELSTQGNFLGWSDAAMFNMVKVLELTLNDGKCMITGEQTGLQEGCLTDFSTYSDLEKVFRKQTDHFIERMMKACELVEECHQEHLPSPFLSSVVINCLQEGKDVTAGGALYNYSGIQAIQPANIADSLAVIKKAVFDDSVIDKRTMLNALRNDFSGYEKMRQYCINRVEKYGNDNIWVDQIGAQWITYFADRLKGYRNFRGGNYQMGLYTVSAHVPMGQNVGATPDGRLSMTPLADGGLSPVYGRDKKGPTASLNSVAKMPSVLASNGALLNMKFLPSVFESVSDRQKFTSLLRSITNLPVHHVQFNVVTSDDLKKAKTDPDSYRDLTIRVAGYTAYFTELAEDLQDEIIERTTYGEEN